MLCLPKSIILNTCVHKTIFRPILPHWVAQVVFVSRVASDNETKFRHLLPWTRPRDRFPKATIRPKTFRTNLHPKILANPTQKQHTYTYTLSWSCGSWDRIPLGYRVVAFTKKHFCKWKLTYSYKCLAGKLRRKKTKWHYLHTSRVVPEGNLWVICFDKAKCPNMENVENESVENFFCNFSKGQ
jgi:hypothetical protein